MADARGIFAIDLGELIGSPLAALVQAEARAAMTTAEFIEEVGFRVEENESDGAKRDPRLRMARFRYTKPGVNGEPAEFTVEVPLLSLMPIPALQIKEATVGLVARITDLVKEPATKESLTAAPALQGRLLDQIRRRKVRIAAKPVASSGSRTQEVRGSYDLDITIKLGQSDTTVGIERLLQVLDQSIIESQGNGD